jgi:hypothetical protein
MRLKIRFCACWLAELVSFLVVARRLAGWNQSLNPSAGLCAAGALSLLLLVGFARSDRKRAVRLMSCRVDAIAFGWFTCTLSFWWSLTWLFILVLFVAFSLSAAALEGYPVVSRMLSPTLSGDELLWWRAFEFGVTRQTIALLVETGVDWNALLPNGLTVLHVAASGGQLETVDALCAAGADREVLSVFGRRALAKAVEMGHFRCELYLRAYGRYNLFGESLCAAVLDTRKEGDIPRRRLPATRALFLARD